MRLLIVLDEIYEYLWAMRAMVILCHDEAIRMQITPCNMQYLSVMFHERKREGGTFERHPTIEDAIKVVRGLDEKAMLAKIRSEEHFQRGEDE